MQKRERDKFEKEESAKKKNSKKGKVRARSRSGPRGFGQKIDEDDELWTATTVWQILPMYLNISENLLFWFLDVLLSKCQRSDAVAYTL